MAAPIWVRHASTCWATVAWISLRKSENSSGADAGALGPDPLGAAAVVTSGALAGGSAALTLVILCGFAAIVGVLTTRQIQQDFSREVSDAADELSREVKLRLVARSDGTRTPRKVSGPSLDDYGGGQDAAVRVITASGEYVMGSDGAPSFGPYIARSANVDGWRVESRPVELLGCTFTAAPDLRMAEFTGLALTGCRMPGLQAGNLRVTADLLLNDGFAADGCVHLQDAQIGGSLRLCKEKFYGSVHDGLRTWVAAAADDGWDVRDVRYGPPPPSDGQQRSPRKVAAATGGPGGAALKKPTVGVLAPKIEIPRLSLALDTPPMVRTPQGGGGGDGWLS